MNKRVTHEEFIVRANNKHNFFYKYVEKYLTMHTKININCPTHGIFTQEPCNHLQGRGCPKCAAKGRPLSTNKFVLTSFFQTHGSFYNYDKMKFIGMLNEIIIVCPTHGDFNQTPANHIRGSGCPKCANESLILEREQVVLNFNKVHFGLYRYNNLVYINSMTEVEITCSIHGAFWLKPNYHLQGQGCPKCLTSGFRIDRPAILYYLIDLTCGLYKIGISNRTLRERFGSKLNEIRVIKIIPFLFGADAKNLEKELHETHAHYRCDNNNFKEVGGYTEFFNYDVLELDNFQEIADQKQL